MIGKYLRKIIEQLFLMFCVVKTKIMFCLCFKSNSNREKQVILLMIPNGEGWHYFAVKKLSKLLRRITSKHQSDFYCVDYLHSLTTENKRESHKNVCKNKDFCDFLIPSEVTKLLEINQYQKFDKAPSIIYADLECLIKKIDGRKIDVKIILNIHL